MIFLNLRRTGFLSTSSILSRSFSNRSNFYKTKPSNRSRFDANGGFHNSNRSFQKSHSPKKFTKLRFVKKKRLLFKGQGPRANSKFQGVFGYTVDGRYEKKRYTGFENRFRTREAFSKKYQLLPPKFYNNLPPSLNLHPSKFSRFAYNIACGALKRDRISHFLKNRRLLRGRLRVLIPLSPRNWKVPPRRYWRARFRWPFEKVCVPEIRVFKSRSFILSFRRPYTSKLAKNFIRRFPASAVPYVLSEFHSPFKSYAKYKTKVKESLYFRLRRQRFGWPRRKVFKRKWWWKRPETFDIFGYSSRKKKRFIPKLRFIRAVKDSLVSKAKSANYAYNRNCYLSKPSLNSLSDRVFNSVRSSNRHARRLAWIPGMWGPALVKRRRYREVIRKFKVLSRRFVRSRAFRVLKKNKKIRLLKTLFLSFAVLDRRSLVQRLPRYKGLKGIYKRSPFYRGKLHYPGIARFSKRSFFHISGDHVRAWNRYTDGRRRRVGRFVLFYYGRKEFMNFAIEAKKQVNFISFRRTANNFFITVFKRSGQLLLSRSAGTLKLKGPRRSTVEAATDLMAKVISELKEKKIRSINVLLRTKRTSRYVRAVLKTFKKLYPTGIGPLFLRLPARSHNGLRSKKRTRG